MSDKTKTIERNVVIKDINVHIKSVFGDKIPLTKALTNIAIQKLSISRRNNNKDVEKMEIFDIMNLSETLACCFFGRLNNGETKKIQCSNLLQIVKGR